MEYIRENTNQCDSMGRPYQCVEINTVTGEKFYLRQDGDWDIQLDLSDEEFLFIAKRAHEQEITFNEFVVNLIKNAIEHKNQK
jgi:hypothetical protein